ncbi:TonB-dependent receptor [Pedobacter chitinilyticus]|uniref:TonB-dependent receptor n=1 Tax=Pedobacter chitinilyticus TaxID=2233776 RepID=A0A3S3PGU2_9SPHI|nr:TonB-dependent receptor [Pedobacter chitinilyticus]RWU07456.1 TonB-dependent receptor [Pedobacter chitinilyticus]
MKKSVWSHQLWQKKMAELPVNDDLDAAWRQMNHLLDQQFVPTSAQEVSLPENGLFAQLAQIIKLILPVVLVAGGVYFAFYQKPKATVQKKSTKQELVEVPRKKQVLENLVVVDTATLMPSEKKVKEMFVKKGKSSSKNSLLKTPSTSPNHPQEIDNLKRGVDAAILLNKAEMQTEIDRPATARASLLPYLDNSVGLGAYQVTADSLKWVPNELMQRGQKDLKSPVVLSKREQRRLRRTLARDSVRKVKEANQLQMANLKPIKEKPKNRKPKEMVTPKFSFELQGGLMFANQNTTPYLGVQTQWTLTNKWLLGTGVRFTQAKMNGAYEHPGYNTVTTGSPFQVLDSRKHTNLVLPLNVSYRLHQLVSLKAEANLAFALAKSGGSNVGYVASYLDTVFHSKQIQQALSETSVNKLHFNIGGGVNIQFKRFNIEAMYFYQPRPYRISSGLGSYQQGYRAFSIGLGYRF